MGQRETELEGSPKSLSSEWAEVGAGARNIWATVLVCWGWGGVFTGAGEQPAGTQAERVGGQQH